MLMVDQRRIEPLSRTHFALLHTAMLLFTTEAPVWADKAPILVHAIVGVVSGPPRQFLLLCGLGVLGYQDRAVSQWLPRVSWP